MARTPKLRERSTRSQHGLRNLAKLAVVLTVSACSCVAVGYESKPPKAPSANVLKKGARNVRRPGAGVTAEQAAAALLLAQIESAS